MMVFVWRPDENPRPEPIQVAVETLPRIGEVLVMPDTLQQHRVVEIVHHADLPDRLRPAMLTEIILAAAHAV